MLVWMTQHLGVIGYAAFSAVQQLIVITGLHHVFGAIESQLLVDTGRNFLNPLMSVAMTAQGGAVLGYLAGHLKDAKAKELCIPSFISVLFGVTEPALFGVNLRYRYPLIGGCWAAQSAARWSTFQIWRLWDSGQQWFPGSHLQIRRTMAMLIISLLM